MCRKDRKGVSAENNTWKSKRNKCCKVFSSVVFVAGWRIWKIGENSFRMQIEFEEILSSAGKSQEVSVLFFFNFSCGWIGVSEQREKVSSWVRVWERGAWVKEDKWESAGARVHGWQSERERERGREWIAAVSGNPFLWHNKKYLYFFNSFDCKERLQKVGVKFNFIIKTSSE